MPRRSNGLHKDLQAIGKAFKVLARFIHERGRVNVRSVNDGGWRLGVTTDAALLV